MRPIQAALKSSSVGSPRCHDFKTLIALQQTCERTDLPRVLAGCELSDPAKLPSAVAQAAREIAQRTGRAPRTYATRVAGAPTYVLTYAEGKQGRLELWDASTRRALGARSWTSYRFEPIPGTARPPWLSKAIALCASDLRRDVPGRLLPRGSPEVPPAVDLVWGALEKPDQAVCVKPQGLTDCFILGGSDPRHRLSFAYLCNHQGVVMAGRRDWSTFEWTGSQI